jgi:hypothetical protein
MALFFHLDKAPHLILVSLLKIGFLFLLDINAFTLSFFRIMVILQLLRCSGFLIDNFTFH